MPCFLDAVSKKVTLNQEIHNYYEEVSTRIRHKLNEFKGLSAAWSAYQQAEADIVQAAADLSDAEEQVQLLTGSYESFLSL